MPVAVATCRPPRVAGPHPHEPVASEARPPCTGRPACDYEIELPEEHSHTGGDGREAHAVAGTHDDGRRACSRGVGVLGPLTPRRLPRPAGHRCRGAGRGDGAAHGTSGAGSDTGRHDHRFDGTWWTVVLDGGATSSDASRPTAGVVPGRDLRHDLRYWDGRGPTRPRTPCHGHPVPSRRRSPGSGTPQALTQPRKVGQCSRGTA